MSIKRGDVVSHSEASEWGIGKVLEVTSEKVTVHFNDGITRKIVSTHSGYLLRAEPTLYLPVHEATDKGVTKTVSKAQKKVKQIWRT